MNRKSVMLGLSAIGALVLAANANAQIAGGVTGRAGVVGQVAAPAPAVPAIPATPAKPAVPAVRGPATPATPAVPATPATPSAAATGADASATTAGQASFPVGTVVKDSAGVQIGTVMAPDPTLAGSGRIAVQTSSGFITVPAGSLTLQGDVAVSAQTSAEIGKPKSE